METRKYLITTGAMALILGLILVWVCGYGVGITSIKCPESKTDTVFVHDTQWYQIPNTPVNYSQIVDSIKGTLKPDTVILPGDTITQPVDTAQILSNYFAKYYYTRTWQDSSIQVVLKDEITQNKPNPLSFSYKILRPQTTIINTTNKQNNDAGISLGIGINPLHLNQPIIELMYEKDKWGAGVEYSYGTKELAIKLEYEIIKLK